MTASAMATIGTVSATATAITAKPEGAGTGESRSFAPPHRLVAGERPPGGAVFDRSGQRIGVIEDVAIDEATGKVAYAILRYGGFLGMGRRCRPVPWSLLAY